MEANNNYRLSFFLKYITIVIVSILLVIPINISKTFSEDFGPPLYIGSIVLICHFFITPKDIFKNVLFWLFLIAHLIIGFLYNFEAIVGCIFFSICNVFNFFSIEQYGRKMILISTQTTLERFNDRSHEKISLLDVLFVPIGLIFMFLCLYSKSIYFEMGEIGIPLFHKL
jgi:hypothetical protein